VRPVVVTGAGLLHPTVRDRRGLAGAAAHGGPPGSPRIPGFDYARWFPDDGKRVKKMDRVSRLACVAALLALRDAGLEPLPDRPRAGLVAGTQFGGLEACLSFHAELLTYGPNLVNPATFPNTAHNVAAGQAAIRLGVEGPVLTLVSGLAAGLDAVVTGARLVGSGRADVVLAGGFDVWLPEIGTALGSLGLLAGEGGEGGLVPAEAACFLVVESEEHAGRRGAPALGAIRGWGQASDELAGRGGVESLGAALAAAMRRALAAAGAESPTALCLGTQGTERYDGAIEAACRALPGAAGLRARLLPKRALGETFGAAGPLAVASVLALSAAGADLGDAVLVDGLAWGGSATAVVVDPHPAARRSRRPPHTLDRPPGPPPRTVPAHGAQLVVADLAVVGSERVQLGVEDVCDVDVGPAQGAVDGGGPAADRPGGEPGSVG